MRIFFRVGSDEDELRYFFFLRRGEKSYFERGLVEKCGFS
jgi:hypothetical protein